MAALRQRRQRPLPGVTVNIDAAAVWVSSQRPLAVLSSAVVGGGFGRTRHIVNMHVDDRYDGVRPQDDLAAFASRIGVREPFVGLMTAAQTEFACLRVEAQAGLTVAAAVSMGLANPECAGVTGPLPVRCGTINAIVLIDAALTRAAMVNAVITVTEAKTMVLGEWDVRVGDGPRASGTSTDSVVIACTQRGERLRYAGPLTIVGWLAARAVREAINQLCEEKRERDGGQRLGW
jgi:adenosylcobinamide hydrolase